jgi:hypothetical protein
MYLGATVTDEGSKPEVLSKIAQASTAFSRFKTINSIQFNSIQYILLANELTKEFVLVLLRSHTHRQHAHGNNISIKQFTLT